MRLMAMKAIKNIGNKILKYKFTNVYTIQYIQIIEINNKIEYKNLDS